MVVLVLVVVVEVIVVVLVLVVVVVWSGENRVTWKRSPAIFGPLLILVRLCHGPTAINAFQGRQKFDVISTLDI